MFKDFDPASLLDSHKTRLLLSVLLFIFLFWAWTKGGLSVFTLDTDFGRDLHQLSNLWQRKVVWLGPQLSAGFHVSPLYYYLFFPALKIAGGDPHSLLIFNRLLAALSLALFIWQGFKKYSFKILPAAGIIGLLPVWLTVTGHPGNGFTYALWLFTALVSLWFKLPLLVSSLLLGVAISFHPAAILAIGPLVYQWWQKKDSFKKLPLVLLALLLPWTPIIVFELITGGFLLRQWLSSPSMAGLSFQFNLDNFKTLASQIKLSWWLLLPFWLLVFFSSKKRLKAWLISLSLPLLLVFLLSPLRPHYLFPLSLAVVFMLVIYLLEKDYGRLLLYTGFVFLALFHLFKPAPAASHRPISQLSQVTDQLVAQTRLTEPLAVLAVLGPDSKVPQADAYRYFLRLKGLKTLDVNQYSQAKTLIIFLEDQDFDWRSWESWELTQFGPKKLDQELSLQDTKVLIFSSAVQ